MLAELGAGPEVLGRGVEVVALDGEHARARRACRPRPGARGARVGVPQRGSNVRCGVAEPALGDLDVGERERAAQDVGEVAAGLEAGDRLGVASLGRVEVAAGPVRQARAGPRRRPAGGVVGAGQVEHPVGVARWWRRCRRRAGRGRPGAWRSWPGAGRSSSWSMTIGRSAPRRASARRCSSSGSTPVGVAGRPCGRRRGACASTGRSAKRSSGRASSQRRSVRLLAGPLHRRRGPLDQLRRAGGVVAGQRVDDRLRRVAVGREPVAGPAVQLGAPARGRSSRSRARSTSPKRWW